MASSPTGRPPALSNSSVAKLLQQMYPFDHVDENSVKQLPSYEDRNFYFLGVLSHTDARSGHDTMKPKEYVLKIFNCLNSTADVVHGISALMEHLQARCFSGAELVKSKEGGNIGIVTERDLCEYVVERTMEGVHENERENGTKIHCVRVIKYLPGELLVSIPKESVSVRLLYDVGKYLGRINAALQDGFNNTALCNQVPVRFNVMHFQSTYRNYISTVEDHQRRRMAKEVLALFNDHVQPHISSFKQGIIYNDANSHNIILKRTSSQDSYEVAGYIDYDDAAYSCYVFDLGKLLAHLFIEKIYPDSCLDPVAFMVPLISGYNRAFSLSQEEMSSLYPVVMACCCQLGMVSAVSSKKEPWNSYILHYVDSSWKAIERLLSIPKTEIDKVWESAMGNLL